MNKILLPLVFAASICGSAVAQTKSPPAPPYVRIPPPGSAWVVEIEDRKTEPPEKEKKEKKEQAEVEGGLKPAEKEAPPVPVRLSMKSGRNNVTMGTITYSNQREEVFYVAGGSIYQQAANSDNVMVRSVKASERDPLSLRVAAFPGLAWLSAEYFAGTKKIEQGELLHFVRAIKLEKSSTTMEAWIRAGDRHPVEASVEDWTFRFGEVTPFEGAISFPDKFQAAATKEREQRNALELIRRINQKRNASQ